MRTVRPSRMSSVQSPSVVRPTPRNRSPSGSIFPSTRYATSLSISVQKSRPEAPRGPERRLVERGRVVELRAPRHGMIRDGGAAGVPMRIGLHRVLAVPRHGARRPDRVVGPFDDDRRAQLDVGEADEELRRSVGESQPHLAVRHRLDRRRRQRQLSERGEVPSADRRRPGSSAPARLREGEVGIRRLAPAARAHKRAAGMSSSPTRRGAKLSSVVHGPRPSRQSAPLASARVAVAESSAPPTWSTSCVTPS